MAAMNPSGIAVTDSVVEAMLPTLIMEDAIVYVPLQARMGLETEQVLVIPEIRIPTDLPGSSMKKSSGSCKSKVVSALLMDDEEAMVEIQLLFDIPPKPPNRLAK